MSTYGAHLSLSGDGNDLSHKHSGRAHDDKRAQGPREERAGSASLPPPTRDH